MKYVATVLCACDVIQPKSSLGVPWDHPAVFIPETAAPVHHDKLSESRILQTGKDATAFYALLQEEMHIRELTRIGPLRRHEQIFLLATECEQSVEL